MNHESISGDCPSTGEYISVKIFVVQGREQNVELGRTDHKRSDITHQLSEPWIVNIFHQQSQHWFKEDIIATGQCGPQAVPVDQLLDHSELRRGWDLL